MDFGDVPIQSRRWFHPAADGLVFGLFAVHGLLLLSQHNGWFSINDCVGRAMVIDLTATVITILLGLICVTSAAFMGWPLQFSLRSLSLLTISIAITSTWLGIEINRERREYEVARAIQKAGGLAGGPRTLLSRLLGDNRLVVVENIEIGSKYRSSFTDSDLLRLKELRRLTRLCIIRGDITDQGLEHLRDHRCLTVLSLKGAEVTDAGMIHLATLTQLTHLSLEDTQVGDDGLQYLRGLDKLGMLNLTHTRVTSRGASEFRREVPGCDVIHW